MAIKVGGSTVIDDSKNFTVGGTLSANSSVGTSGQVLQSTGTGVQWVTNTASGINTGDETAATIKTKLGTLPVVNGGTGVTTSTGTGSTVLSASPTFTGTLNSANLAYTGTLTGSTGILNIGSGQVYKDASGNVGIGTSSPTGKLDVVSGIDNTDTSYAKQQLTVVGANKTLASGLGNLQIVTNDNSNLADFGGSLSFGGRYAISDARSLMWAGIKGAKENSINGSLLGYLAFSTSLVERMRIDSSGNVGIGTSSPTSRLTVSNTTDNSVPLTVAGSSSLIKDYGPSIDFRYSVSGQVLANIKGAWDTTSHGGFGNLIFSTRGEEVVSERMRIDSFGNVGIGTSSPAAKLHVVGEIRTPTRLTASEVIAGYVPGVSNIFIRYVTGNNHIDSYNDPITSGIPLVINTGTTLFHIQDQEKMRIDSSGNVGIGKSSPATKLDVTGTVTATTFSGAGTGLTGTANSLNAGMGVNQTWQTTETLSRAIGTTYTNSTGKPITVVIAYTNSVENTVQGLIIGGIKVYAAGSPILGFGSGFTIIVPNGATYVTTTNFGTMTLVSWVELR